MKVLMFGETGQVAREVLRRANGAEIVALGREAADLSDPAACAARIRESDADVILNAAAWTNVDGAEDAEDEAAVVNGAAPTAMAEAAAAKGTPIIHISTDYVFDGSGDAARAEDAPTAPRSAYGWTKLAGEQGVIAAGGAHAILRTSWVFSAHGSNFLKTMLRLGRERDSLTVVDDQIGGPTPAAAIADACLAIANGGLGGEGPSGVYHFSGWPDLSWRGFAEAIFEAADLTVDVAPILTKDWPAKAARPANSRMDCAKIARDYGVARPDWRVGLREVLGDLDPTTAREAT